MIDYSFSWSIFASKRNEIPREVSPSKAVPLWDRTRWGVVGLFHGLPLFFYFAFLIFTSVTRHTILCARKPIVCRKRWRRWRVPTRSCHLLFHLLHVVCRDCIPACKQEVAICNQSPLPCQVCHAEIVSPVCVAIQWREEWCLMPRNPLFLFISLQNRI